MNQKRKDIAFIFDLGGVIVDIDFNLAFQSWTKISKYSATEISRLFEMDEQYAKHERGEISWKEYCDYLRRSLLLNGADEDIKAGWNAIFKNEFSQVTEAIREVNSEVVCAVLSNSNPTHQLFWSRKYAKALNLFDQVFVSSDIGFRKPESRCFEFISTEIDVPLERCVFFDDMVENVCSASKSGVDAVLVEKPSDVIDKLAILNLT